MSSSQVLLNVILFTVIFTIALELKPDDFIRVAKNPLPVAAGLVAQFLLLPVDTFVATLLLELPANIETGMLTVAGLWAIWHNTSGFALAYVLRVRSDKYLKSINFDNL